MRTLKEIHSEFCRITDRIDSENRLPTEAEEAKLADLDQEFKSLEMSLGNPTSGRKAEPQQPQSNRQPGSLKNLPGIKTYYSGAGPVHEVSAKARVSDVVAPATTPEIPFERWLAAAVLGDKCGDDEAKKYAMDIRASLGTGTSGVTIPTQYQGQWIDVLRANSVLVAAGSTTVPMPAKSVQWSAVTADPTASWHDEAATINATDPTFALRTLTAKTLAVRTQISMEVAMDSPDFGGQLTGVFARAMAAEMDRAGLHGASNGPDGLLGTSGIGQVTGIGALSNYDDFVTGFETLLDANNSLESVNQAVIMSPRTWADLERLKTGISSDETQLVRPKSLESTRFLTTSNVSDTVGSPATDSTVFMGDWSQFFIGVRADANIQILQTSTYASNLLFEVIGYLRCDFLVARPASFVTLEGITS